MRGSRRGTGQDKGARDGDRALGAVSAARNVKPAGERPRQRHVTKMRRSVTSEQRASERETGPQRGSAPWGSRVRTGGLRPGHLIPTLQPRRGARTFLSVITRSPWHKCLSLCPRGTSRRARTPPVRSPLFPLKSFTELHRGETRGPDGGGEARSRRRRGC